MGIQIPNKKAVIYARVSTQKQVTEGSGIETQIQRCTEYCVKNNLNIDKIFKDEGVSGKIENRKAIKLLLLYIHENKEEGTVLIIDDIKRLARDTSVYLTLKANIERLNCKIHYLNHKFDDSPASRMIETILSATAQLEREEGAKQTKQKMIAKMKMGYWILSLPLGLTRTVVNGNKVIVADPETKDIMVRMLKDFANRILGNFSDCRRYLLKHGIKKTETRIRSMLESPLYAGYYEYPSWNIQFMRGIHEPLIDLHVYNDIQERLGNKTIRGVNRSINEEIFYLKEFMYCASCSKRLTTSTTKNRHGKRYFHHLCKYRQCKDHNVVYQVKDLENQVRKVLLKIKVNESTQAKLKITIENKVNEYIKNAKNKIEKNNNRVIELDEQIKNLVSKITKTNDYNLTTIYENTLKEMVLERDISKLKSDGLRMLKPFQKELSKLLDAIFNPDKHWDQGDWLRRQLILRIYLDSQIYISKNESKNICSNPQLSQVVTSLNGGDFVKNTSGAVNVCKSKPSFIEILLKEAPKIIEVLGL